MGGLVAELGRTLVFIGLTIVLGGCGWVLALVDHSWADVSLWALAPALFVIGSASGSLSSIQRLASAIGSVAVTSIFFQAATSVDPDRNSQRRPTSG